MTDFTNLNPMHLMIDMLKNCLIYEKDLVFFLLKTSGFFKPTGAAAAGNFSFMAHHSYILFGRLGALKADGNICKSWACHNVMIVPSRLPAASEFGISVKNVTDPRVAMDPAVPDSIEGEIVKVHTSLVRKVFSPQVRLNGAIIPTV